jgi:hypothetical protein
MRTSCHPSPVLVLLGLCLCDWVGAAEPALPEKLRISIEASDGRSLPIGTLHLVPQDGGYRTRVTLDDSAFEAQFLSMRPFQCLPHPEETVCYLPYPYENRRFIRDGDLTDLEYDLLFLHKSPAEYGIDAWNGFYYRLSRTPDGFTGTLYETDLNVLAAPPERGELRPIKPSELYEASDRHWPRRLTIH